MNPTPIQQKLDSDFAALFGPSQPQHLPPQELQNGTQTSERQHIA